MRAALVNWQKIFTALKARQAQTHVHSKMLNTLTMLMTQPLYNTDKFMMFYIVYPAQCERFFVLFPHSVYNTNILQDLSTVILSNPQHYNRLQAIYPSSELAIRSHQIDIRFKRGQARPQGTPPLTQIIFIQSIDHLSNYISPRRFQSELLEIRTVPSATNIGLTERYGVVMSVAVKVLVEMLEIEDLKLKELFQQHYDLFFAKRDPAAPRLRYLCQELYDLSHNARRIARLDHYRQAGVRQAIYNTVAQFMLYISQYMHDEPNYLQTNTKECVIKRIFNQLIRSVVCNASRSSTLDQE
jgi:hypothetical protein